MEGRNHFLNKAFSLVMDMDQLVGADFERGLGALKAAAENSARSNAAVTLAAP